MGSDIHSWLENLGLGRYAEAFDANGVGFDLLPELTNADLKDLGITALADRKLLLKAIAGLAPPPLSTSSPTKGTLVAPAREAERRQLTVMFCDLVGSTALSGLLDPEQMREVLRAYQTACAAVIDQYDGYIAKLIGDGLLIYFGVPRAHEDDAERALRAALGIVEAVPQLNRRLLEEMNLNLSVRVGIHTGLVVVGDMSAGTTREELAIVGETPNIAARLQSLAGSNRVVISSSTQRLVGDLFTFEDMGLHELKGVARPTKVWRVLGERPIESRFAALHGARTLAMVGRAGELDLLLRSWDEAKQGCGQVVLLQGEAGIGKSRLIEALRERISAAPHVQLRHQCSAYFTNSGLHPFVRQFEQAAELLPGDSVDAKLRKLERQLGLSGQTDAATVFLFAKLLSVPIGEQHPVLDLTSQRLKELTLAALVDRAASFAAESPVLFVLEDAHWIDPSSEEFISLAIDRVVSTRILIIVTYRPDYIPPWSKPAHLTVLTLNRLGGEHAVSIIGELASALPAELVGNIVGKADGVPLFVEELTKAVMESSALADVGTNGQRRNPSPLVVPSTLQDALMARLDRSAPMKEVAQTAAVLGREFSEVLLAAVSPLDGRALGHALNELLQAELLFRREQAQQTSYIFKHALLQDAAYESLLLTKRKLLHARAAEVLEQQFPEITEAQPELLARHYDIAEMADRAITYWQRAGTNASQSSNYIEAERQLTRAIELVSKLPVEQRSKAEFDLQMMLGAVCRAMRGSGSSHTERAYRRARALCEEIGIGERLLEVIYGQCVCAINRPKLHDAAQYAKEFMEIAACENKAAAQLVAHRLAGSSAFLLGDFVRARSQLEECLRIDSIDRTALNLYSQGQNTVMALTYLAWALFALGYPNQAHSRSREAVAASEGNTAFLRTMALSNGCYLFQICGDYVAVERNLSILLDLAATKGIVVFHEIARVFHGWTRACRGGADEGIELMCSALEKLAATEQRLDAPYLISILADTYRRNGRWAEAQVQLDEALARVEATDERWFEAELHRLAGKVALGRGDVRGAEVAFDRALTVAIAQSAGMWALRAATSLATLWREAGKAAEARMMLEPILSGFTEGFDTADVMGAKSILKELAQLDQSE